MSSFGNLDRFTSLAFSLLICIEESEAVQKLEASNIDWDSEEAKEKSQFILESACKGKALPVVTFLLGKGNAVPTPEALIAAVDSDRVSTVEYLLKTGLNPNLPAKVPARD